VQVINRAAAFNSTRSPPMDDYQEELLEYQAFEFDPLDPVDDATEL
jgi:hypothetical protein